MTLCRVEADGFRGVYVNTLCLVPRSEILSEWLLAQVMLTIRTRFSMIGS